MPYKDREKRREYDRLYKRAWRVRRKAEDARRHEEELHRREWDAARQDENRVPLVLTEPLHIDGHTFERGTVVYVQPGVVHRWQRALLADPAASGETVVITRVITGTPPDRIVTEPQEPPKTRTAAGY